MNFKTCTMLEGLNSHIVMAYFKQVGGICSCCTPLLEPELKINPLHFC